MGNGCAGYTHHMTGNQTVHTPTHLLFKRLAAIDKVARIDADLLDSICHDQSDLGLEVHVGAQRYVVTPRIKALTNLEARLRILHPHDSEAHKVETLIRASDDLFD